MKHSRQSRLGITVGTLVFVGINFILFQNCSRNVFRTTEPVEFFQTSQSPQQTSNEQSSNLPPTNNPPEFTCPAIICAKPPTGCSYQTDQSNMDENGNLISCPQSCGKLVCGTKPKDCPMISCAAPPEGCRYSGAGIVKDNDNCDVGCGQIVCEDEQSTALAEAQKLLPINIKGGFKACPQVGFLCVLPAANCHYDASTAFDANGCQVSCGKLICEPDPEI